MRSLIKAVACMATALILSSGSASAQDKMVLGYTATAEYAGAFVAAEQGFFKKHGLDIQLQLIGLNSTLPAALQSNSIQIGGPTPSVFLQAVAGGLDLVVISGNSVLVPTSKAFGVVAKAGSGIKTAKDFEEHKVGVPGIGAFLQVIFRKWLADQGADVSKVDFVEVSFPQMNDVLKAGTVDAVVTGDPIMARIVSSGTGTLVSHMAENLPPQLPIIFYATTRAYATAHPKLAADFRAALEDAKAYIEKNPAGAREAISKYTKMAPAFVASIPLPAVDPSISDKQLQEWVNIMLAQKMLEKKLDTSKLIVK